MVVDRTCHGKNKEDDEVKLTFLYPAPYLRLPENKLFYVFMKQTFSIKLNQLHRQGEYPKLQTKEKHQQVSLFILKKSLITLFVVQILPM